MQVVIADSTLDNTSTIILVDNTSRSLADGTIRWYQLVGLTYSKNR